MYLSAKLGHVLLLYSRVAYSTIYMYCWCTFNWCMSGSAMKCRV